MNNSSRGEKIKSARKKAHISQKELGERLGVTQAMISAYEQGIRRPKLETMQKIATALGIDERELFDGDLEYIFHKAFEETDLEERKDALIIDGILVSEKNLIRKYRKLNSEGKAEAIKRVEELSYIPKFTSENSCPFD